MTSKSRTTRSWSVGKFLTALSVCFISAAIVTHYIRERQAVRDRAYRELSAIAHLKAAQLQAWRSERMTDATVIAHSPWLRTAVSRLVRGPRQDATRSEIRRRFQTEEKIHRSARVVLASPGGKLLLDEPPTNPALNPTETDLVLRAAGTQLPSSGDFFLSQGEESLFLDFAAPVMEEHGGVIAVVLIRADVDTPFANLLARWPGSATTARSLLVAPLSGSLSVWDPARSVAGPAGALGASLWPDSSPLSHALSTRSGFVSGRDDRGIDVIADVVEVPGSRWKMVALLGTSEFLSEFNYRTATLVAFGIFTLFLAVAWASSLYQRREKELYRRLHAQEVQRVALLTHFEHVVRDAHDAMLLASEDLRIVEANGQAQVLYQYSQFEILKLTLPALRSASVLPAPLDSPELAHGLTFETTHRRKDGTEFPVEVSARIIQVDGSRFYHEIVRDISERIQAAEALAASRELFRTTLYSIGDAVITTDRSGRIQALNSVAEQLTAWTESEACGLPALEVFKIYSEESGQRSACIVQRVLREGVVIGLANHSVLESRDGQRYPVEDSAAPIRDSAGNVVGVVVVFRDVTEKRRAESALRESENRFRRLAENAADIVYRFEFSPHCGFSYLSPACLNLTGYAPEDLYANPGQAALLASASRRQDLERLFGQASAPRGCREVEWLHRDGHRVYLEIRESPIFDSRGGLIAVEGIARDVTERRQRENSLRRLSQIVEQSPISILVAGKSGSIEYVNPQFSQLTGHSPAGVIHTDARLLLNHDPSGGDSLPDGPGLAAGQVWKGDLSLRAKDGNTIATRTAIAPIMDGDGSISGYAAMFEDISAQRQLERQFRQAQKMEAVGRLAGGVAHDFNNLLTVIIGYGEVIYAAIPSQDPLHTAAAEILSAGERAAELTQQLLAFSRKQSSQPKVTNLNEIVNKCRGMFTRWLGEDIRLSIHLDPSLGNVRADPGQLHQVLMNLIVNARDAMPQGGTVTIETSNVEFDASSLGNSVEARPGRYVRLRVTDTGVGMDEEVQKLIFEPFFTSKEEGKGTGLGLATVYGILRHYGGWIEVRSAPAQGASFSVYLRRCEAPVDEQDTPAFSTPAAGGNQTILLVDDREDVLAFAAAVLEGAGYRVLTASGGEEAIEIAAQYRDPIHLLMTDAVMPGMKGADLARRLRSSSPTLPVVIISGYSTDVDAVSRHDSFFHLAKPFSGEALLRQVHRAILSSPPS